MRESSTAMLVAACVVLATVGFGGGFTYAQLSDTETAEVSVSAGEWDTATPESLNAGVCSEDERIVKFEFEEDSAGSYGKEGNDSAITLSHLKSDGNELVKVKFNSNVGPVDAFVKGGAEPAGGGTEKQASGETSGTLTEVSGHAISNIVFCSSDNATTTDTATTTTTDTATATTTDNTTDTAMVKCGFGDAGADRVGQLTIRYTGDEAASIKVTTASQGGPNMRTFHDGEVDPGEEFNVSSIDDRNGEGDLKFFVDEKRVASLHVSCSEPLGPGTTFGNGDFEITTGEDTEGNELAPVQS